jgi:hypothetical protein
MKPGQIGSKIGTPLLTCAVTEKLTRRAGLTYVPMAVTFGLVGYCWRRLPAGARSFIVPADLTVSALAYLGIAAGVRGGAQSGFVRFALAAAGLGLGLSVGPLLTQALAHVPPARAADASGLLTRADAALEVALKKVRPGLARRYRPGTPVHFAGAGVEDVCISRLGAEIGHDRVPDVQAAAFRLQTERNMPGRADHGGGVGVR